jgi:crossover junction endodeoxyribonuclease RuvC
MRILGIDPGTASTGFGVVEENAGELTAVAFGVIHTPAHTPMPERLLDLHRQLAQILSLHKPACAAVERLFFQKNVRTALAVGQARGVALMTLAQSGIPVAEYTPSEVKQAVASYGGAEKRQVQEMVKILLRLQAIPQPDDAADALAIAICHTHAARWAKISEGE